MEFKRCERCGSFYSGFNSVCGNCVQKENLDMSKLKNYLEEANENEEETQGIGNLSDNIDNISYATGITSKNLTRQLQNEIIFKDLNTKF